jgi:hypothetical protein
MSDFIEKYKISAEIKKGFAINIRFLFFFADYESDLINTFVKCR